MREIIQKIITTESDARHTVEAARTEAERILSDAHEKGCGVVEKSRQEALVEAEKILENAIETAKREKQSSLANAAVEIESQIQIEPSDRELAIEGAVRCVIK